MNKTTTAKKATTTELAPATKGTCPVCKRENVRVDDKGLLGRHVGTEQGVRCEGSGKKAKTAKATPAKAPKATTPKVESKVEAPKASKSTPPANPTSAAPKGHPGHLFLKTMTDAGLSQTACANKMGVAPMTLNRLVNGHGIPTAKVTVAFARAVDGDVEALWSAVCAYELAEAVKASK